jgi:hypothetical protein
VGVIATPPLKYFGVLAGQVFTFGVDLRIWGLIRGLPTG